MGDDGLGVFLKIIGRQRVFGGSNKRLKISPGAARGRMEGPRTDSPRISRTLGAAARNAPRSTMNPPNQIHHTSGRLITRNVARPVSGSTELKIA